ncbi:MAG: PQQ-binding-like beta-propeller repeat protein [Nitrososphaerota archaeon]|jgi:outer membrane protein assembly factor BamB|nr:PQQ-binding-like beta-propeller repeat protein [Nitrososphaerota archaeon]
MDNVQKTLEIHQTVSKVNSLYPKVKHFSIPITTTLIVALLLSATFLILNVTPLAQSATLTTTLTDDPLSPSKMLWKYTPSNGVHASPTVVDGIVYLNSQIHGEVSALNATTGTNIWTYNNYIMNVIAGSPAVADGRIYVLTQVSFWVLNATDSTELWSLSLGGLSTPVVVNGIVYFSSQHSYDGMQGSSVFAFNAIDGTKLWNYTIPGGGSSISSSPAVVGEVVYVGADDNNVYALDAKSGRVLWYFATGSRVDSSPAVVNDLVYVGSGDHSVYALNAKTGKKVWSYLTGGGVSSSPSVVDGVVYVGSEEGNVYALDASNGKKLWSYTTGDIVVSSRAVAYGVVYVSSCDGAFYFLDATSGEKLWSTFEYGGGYESPIVVDGVLYICANSNLYAFNAIMGPSTSPGPSTSLTYLFIIVVMIAGGSSIIVATYYLKIRRRIIQ